MKYLSTGLGALAIYTDEAEAARWAKRKFRLLAMPLQEHLRRTERTLCAMLRENGAQAKLGHAPKGWLVTTFGAVKLPPAPRDPPRQLEPCEKQALIIIHDAREALDRIQTMRRFADIGANDQVIFYAVELGRVLQRLDIRWIEGSQRAARSKGGKARRKRIRSNVEAFERDVLKAYAEVSKHYAKNVVSESYKLRQVADTVKNRKGEFPSEETVRIIVRRHFQKC